ncbi:MAG: SH3 domain-containing protein [Anaerolineales bacterium]|jgi:hypothetical protein|nr:SH3 domain-containing protein [Anaerolineales bacterium]
MKEPLRTRYAPGYDLFKLIVAIILTIILIILLLRERDGRLAALQMAVSTLTETVSLVMPTATFEPPVLTPEPTQTEEPPAEPQVASDLNECPSNPTRIQVGFTVRVLDWLNFRAAPGLGKTIQHTNSPGTEMEVIGGPICAPQSGEPPRAYLWWNVRMEDGREGWSAEAPLNFPNYFLEPVE